MEASLDGARPWLARPWIYLLWAAIAGVFVWQTYLAISNSWRGERTRADHVSDFSAFYAAGKLAWAGENIYDFKKSGVSRRPYLYPPTFAVMVMMPLALLPYNAAVVVFSLLNGLLLVGTLWLLTSILWFNGSRVQGFKGSNSAWREFLLHPNTALLLASAVSFRFISQNWRHGNVNMFLVFLVVLALWLMLKPGRKNEFWSGVSIALATAFKVTPGIYGLYLFWSRRVYGMLGGALGLIAFLLLIPALALGWTYNVERLQEYKGHMKSAVSGEDEDADAIGHARVELKETEGGLSIRGTLMRYMTYKPMKYTKDGVVKYYGVNFMTLPDATARMISYVYEALLALLTIFLTAREAARTRRDGIILSFGLVAICMLLITPLTRPANLCVLVLPCAALIAQMQRGALAGRARTFAIAALAALLLSGVIFSEGIVGPLYGEWFSHAGIKGLHVLLLLYAANAWAVWKVAD